MKEKVDKTTILIKYEERVEIVPANMNVAVLGIQLENEKMYLVAYAKEGFIKQRTAEKAIEKVKKILK